MKFIKSKKGLALLTVLAVAAAAAVGAYAYFTSTGNGTSSAGSVGSATSWLVTGGSIVGTLYPDTTAAGPDQGVITGASVKNQATNGNQNLNKVVATIVSVTQGPTSYPLEAACSATDFQFNSPGASWSGTGTQTATILPDVDLAPGASYSISDLNVALVDDNAAQDNCQGASVKVRFDAS